jgi:hypothetical protein
MPEREGCRARGGRFGTHNRHEHHEQPVAKQLGNTTARSFFKAGVWIHDICTRTGQSNLPSSCPSDWSPRGSRRRKSKMSLSTSAE